MTPVDAGVSGYSLLLKQSAGAGGVAMATRALREPGPDEALVRVRRAAICGTDLHILNWNAWAARSYRLPMALGHEFSGDVVRVGSAVRGIVVGDRVCAETHLACGQCAQCRMGRGHTCLNLQVFTRLDQGAFGRYTMVPAVLLRKLPQQLAHRHGCLLEPLGIAARAVIEAGVRRGALLVSGCGPIGLLAIAAARALGVRWIAATDLSQTRRSLALEMGATVAFDPREGDVHHAAGAQAPPDGIDAAVEASGAADAIRAAVAAVRPGGTVVLTGLPPAPVELDLARHVILREVVLRGIYGRELERTWREVEALLPRLGDALDRIVTHEFELEDFDEAFATALSGNAGKVQFRLD
jgi:threonine 3-dehydrogenase